MFVAVYCARAGRKARKTQLPCRLLFFFPKEKNTEMVNMLANNETHLIRMNEVKTWIKRMMMMMIVTSDGSILVT